MTSLQIVQLQCQQIYDYRTFFKTHTFNKMPQKAGSCGSPELLLGWASPLPPAACCSAAARLCLPADKSLVSVHITPSHYQAIQSQTMPCNAIHAVWPVHLVMHTKPSLENLHCCPAAFDTLIYFAAWLNAAQKRWLEECSHIRHSCSTTVPLSTTTTITPDTHLQGRNTNTNSNTNAISFANTITKRHRL